ETDHPRSADAVARSVSGAEGSKARALALALSPDPTPQPSGPRGGEGLPGGQTQAGGQPDPAADVFGLAQLAAVGEDTAGVGGGSGGTGIVDRKSNTSELQSRGHLVCRLLLEKKKQQKRQPKCPHESTEHAESDHH